MANSWGDELSFRQPVKNWGDNITDLEANVDGEGVVIAFNAKFLIDVLSVMNGSQIVLETSAPASPGMLKMVGDESFSHVIMPTHLSR